jgi:hypothetical protein
MEKTGVEIPAKAEVVHFGAQGEDFFLWAVVDPNANREKRIFIVFGTGGWIPEGFSWRGTTQAPPYVWHLFEEAPHA